MIPEEELEISLEEYLLELDDEEKEELLLYSVDYEDICDDEQ